MTLTSISLPTLSFLLLHPRRRLSHHGPFLKFLRLLLCIIETRCWVLLFNNIIHSCTSGRPTVTALAQLDLYEGRVTQVTQA